VTSQRTEPLRGGVADAGDVDLIDAQLSALLESVEADRANARPVVAPPRAPTVARTTRPPRRARGPATEAAHGLPERRRTTRVRSGDGFAPKVVRPKPPWARIPFVGDPATREPVYYLIAAVILGMGLGLLCTRLFM
jgi:hypothetical protein